MPQDHLNSKVPGAGILFQSIMASLMQTPSNPRIELNFNKKKKTHLFSKHKNKTVTNTFILMQHFI